MTPEAFCAVMRRELAELPGDDSCVRGVLGLCDMYAAATPDRFETILEHMARGSTASALAEGARWLLPRWRASAPPHA